MTMKVQYQGSVVESKISIKTFALTLIAMLRRVAFHSFIHFTQPQTLNFDDGSNFIIGGNSSGKTAVFELIRRCCSNKVNSTTSTFDTKHGLPYTLCHFNISKDSKFPVKRNKAPNDLLAGMFVRPVEGRHNQYYFYKLLVVINQDKSVEEVFVTRCSGDANCSVRSLESPDFLTCDPKLNNIAKDCCTIIDSKEAPPSSKTLTEDLHSTIVRLLSSIIRVSVDDEYKYVESRAQAVYEWLDDRFVAIMSGRSIGPLQWSRSQFIQNKDNDNYEKASSRAEILLELLELRDKNDPVQFDYSMYSSLHDPIVHPYRFKKESASKIVFYNEENTRKMPILKCPDGILESEQLALILSTKSFQTITIEEPERGMHPHMVAKVRDWMFKKVKNKTVLVITHDPVMLDHVTIDRTFICSKKVDNGILSHSIMKYPKDYRKFGRVDEMKVLLFSERVLFVEGFTDKIILEAIFDKLVNETDSLKQSIDESTIRHLSTIHVIEMDGAGAGQKNTRFCKELEKEHFFLYDLDQVKGSSKRESFNVNIKTGYFDEDFLHVQELKKDKDKLKEFESECEREKKFVWLDGGLENVINTCADHLDDDVKERLNIPMVKRKHFKEWKKSLVDKDDKDISQMAKALINNSDEVKRFIKFIETMKSNEGYESTISGRLDPQQAKRKLDLEQKSELVKRQKSYEKLSELQKRQHGHSGDALDSRIENVEASGSSGATQEMMHLDIVSDL